MRIVLVEVREQGSVSELLQARGIVSHNVYGSREVLVPAVVTVAVGPLMLAGVVAEVGGSAIAGDCAAGDS